MSFVLRAPNAHKETYAHPEAEQSDISTESDVDAVPDVRRTARNRGASEAVFSKARGKVW